MQKDFILFSIFPCVSFLSVSLLSFLSQMHCNKSKKFQTSGLGRTLEYTGLLMILAILSREPQKNEVIHDISLLGSIQ